MHAMLYKHSRIKIDRFHSVIRCPGSCLVTYKDAGLNGIFHDGCCPVEISNQKERFGTWKYLLIMGFVCSLCTHCYISIVILRPTGFIR